MFALAVARKRGFTIDRDVIQEQLELTEAFLKEGAESYRKGKGQGGGISTAGYVCSGLSRSVGGKRMRSRPPWPSISCATATMTIIGSR